MIRRQRLDPVSFREHRPAFERLYLAGFPAAERRRIDNDNHDAGLLPGPSITEWLQRDCFHLVGFLDDDALVGFFSGIDLGIVNVGDYLVRDERRPDLVGLGARMLTDWFEGAARQGQDAVVEIESVARAPDPEQPGLGEAESSRRKQELVTRRRRRALFLRYGFRMLDDVEYNLPTGCPMSLGVRSAAPLGCGNPRPVDEIVRLVRATYE